VAFQQLPQRSNLSQVFDRHGRDLEAALAFRQHKPFGSQAVEDFTQGGNARTILVLQPFQPQSMARRQLAEDDVVAHLTVGLFTNGKGRVGHVEHRRKL
jgi:hypothetical protein